jgi:hypothetical protein
MLFVFPFHQLFNLYSLFSILLHIVTILSLMSDWHMYFLGTSSLFTASRSVTLSLCLLHVACLQVVQDVWTLDFTDPESTVICCLVFRLYSRMLQNMLVILCMLLKHDQIGETTLSKTVGVNSF